MPMPSLEIMLRKRALPTNVHKYMHTYICEKRFTKLAIGLGINIPISFSGMALNAFWKKTPLHIYLYTNIRLESTGEAAFGIRAYPFLVKSPLNAFDLFSFQ